MVVVLLMPSRRHGGAIVVVIVAVMICRCSRGGVIVVVVMVVVVEVEVGSSCQAPQGWCCRCHRGVTARTPSLSWRWWFADAVTAGSSLSSRRCCGGGGGGIIVPGPGCQGWYRQLNSMPVSRRCGGVIVVVLGGQAGGLGNKSAVGLGENFDSPCIVLIYFPEPSLNEPLWYNGLTRLVVTVFGSRKFNSQPQQISG